ncbi:MAG: hypothetical protein IPG68_16095 [Micrococcales bacterium]|nr:hypothetical protein [Micrococcales bacterium]
MEEIMASTRAESGDRRHGSSGARCAAVRDRACHLLGGCTDVPGPQDGTDSIDTSSVTPEVSGFYDTGAGWQPGPLQMGTRARRADRRCTRGNGVSYRIMYQSTDLEGNAIP